MKSYFIAGVAVVLLVLTGFVVYNHINKSVNCPMANCSCATSNNATLRWVKDVNMQQYYYGWYESDNSAFNCVLRSNVRAKMGPNVKTNALPVYFWERVK